VRSWLAMKLLSRTMAHLRAGDPGPTLQLDAEDVCLHFPGGSSWSGEFRGKAAVGAWLARFAEVGLQIYPDEVMVKGPPWHMSLAVRGHVDLHAPEGSLIYDNRFVLWGYLRWGRLTEYEAYEDTQKSVALDDYLASHTPREPN
jgi:ketosteroid isomerase-like protein